MTMGFNILLNRLKCKPGQEVKKEGQYGVQNIREKDHENKEEDERILLDGVHGRRR